MAILLGRILFVLFCVAMFLSIGVIFYQLQWFNCRDWYDRGFVPSRRRMDDPNANRLKSRLREPIRGEELFRAFDGVKMFLMFIGYPRTGHSLVGSLLDAHPQVVIPHEYNIMKNFEKFKDKNSNASIKTLKYTLFYELFALAKQQALFIMRSPQLSNTSVYGYHVPGAWQGTYKHSIQVIGDKKGGWTSSQSPAEVISFLAKLEKVVRVPIKLIHVVRNPFDNIATCVLRGLKERDNLRNSKKQVKNSKLLDKQIDKFIHRAFTCNEIIKQFGGRVLTLKSHEMIERPRETLQKLCNHLMVTCYPEYVEACIKILYKKPVITRNSLVWTNEQKERVLKEMRNYSFFKDYNFEDIP